MQKSSSSSLRVPYALAVHDRRETKRVLKVLDEHRTNMGKETQEFEKRIANLFGKKYGIMVNSGSSANLLAVELLCLPIGSEVITPLLTFSTTVSPLLKKGLVPVFTDAIQGAYVIDATQIEKLITKKTKALMIPLLLGNVPDLEKIANIAIKYNLYFIEDSCDTLGATFNGKPSGTFSDISTASFFGSHIITAGGNGGMILVNNRIWRDRAKVLRGWGRRSSLFGESENIDDRFKTKIGNTPYDAKFIFDEAGYNFLPNEMGAAFGNAQIEKLPKFRTIREKNFKHLLEFFSRFEKYFILPFQDPRAQTQWLAFPLTIKKSSPFKRLQIVTFLEKNNIQTRPIFTGNILKQPGFENISYRIIQGRCPVTNNIMEMGFVIGCHQGIETRHLKKIEDVFTSFLKEYL